MTMSCNRILPGSWIGVLGGGLVRDLGQRALHGGLHILVLLVEEQDVPAQHAHAQVLEGDGSGEGRLQVVEHQADGAAGLGVVAGVEHAVDAAAAVEIRADADMIDAG